MNNRLCTTLGIEKPVLLAPMAGAVTADLVSAVSNAGGLGIAPIWRLGLDAIRAELQRIRGLTDKPFGVNLNMGFPNKAQLDVCLEEGVSIVSFFWGQPGDWVSHAQSGGAKVIYTADSAQDARIAKDSGVDVICAQGWEAGGHVAGTVGTMALVPAVADAVGDLPVVAAGGISDARGVAAALALGASGVWVGTRFLAASEASVAPEYLQHLLAASENDTAHFDDLFDIGWPDAPHRALRNSTIAQWQDAGRPPAGSRPGEGEAIARSAAGTDILRYQSATPGAGVTGDIEALSMWAGQGVAQVRRVQPAREIVDALLAGVRWRDIS